MIVPALRIFLRVILSCMRSLTFLLLHDEVSASIIDKSDAKEVQRQEFTMSDHKESLFPLFPAHPKGGSCTPGEGVDFELYLSIQDDDEKKMKYPMNMQELIL